MSIYFCLSFVLGIFISSFWEISLLGQLIIFIFYLKIAIGLILGVILGLCFLIILRIFKNIFLLKKILVICFCLFFLLIGVWRYQTIQIKFLNNELRKYNNSEENISLMGIVSEETEIKGKKQKIILRVITEDNSSFFEGRVLITTSQYPQYQYGDKLRIIGMLRDPIQDINGFNYKNYLKKEGIYSVMLWPKIEKIGENFGNPLMKILFSFKNKFKEIGQKLIPLPQEGILEALIFGDEKNISQEWKEKLNLTATRHITAVSGMNITIITFLIFNFFLLLGFWRHQAFYFSLILLILYIFMIGSPPSAIRAGIMGSILIFSQYWGKMFQAQRAVVLAGTMMLFINPLFLRLDIGFQLSFMAILGIIYLESFFSEKFKKIPNPKIFPLRQTLSTVLAAQIFTSPILIYNFGYISLVSIITNILIVPFLAPLTILIFIFGLSGMVFWFFGWLFSFPVWFCLSYIVILIDWFSKFPFIALRFQNVHWVFLIIAYFILGFIAWRLQHKQKMKFLN